MRDFGKIVVALTTILTATGASIGGAAAQQFPDKPVRVVSGFPAGGGTDAIARYISGSVSETLKQSVLVENRPGAGGGVAAAYVKNMPADGYTILQTISGTVSMEPAFEKLEYNADDFTYLAAVVQFQEAIVARADAPWNDLGELLKSDKAGTGDITFGSQGRVDRLIVDAINADPKYDISIVPFPGGPDIIAAILGGHIDMGWSGTLHVPLIESGQMKALAVPGDTRYDRYPDTPTLTELGFPLSLNMYSIFAVPAGTPQDVVNVLSDAILKAAAEPGFLELCKKYNFNQRQLGPKETAAMIAKQYDQVSRAITQAQ